MHDGQAFTVYPTQEESKGQNPRVHAKIWMIHLNMHNDGASSSSLSWCKSWRKTDQNIGIYYIVYINID